MHCVTIPSVDSRSKHCRVGFENGRQEVVSELQRKKQEGGKAQLAIFLSLFSTPFTIMDAHYGATRFTSASNLEIDTIQLSAERLEDATRHLAERIPGRENLTKVMKVLKRSGLEAIQTSTTLAQTLNSKKEHDVAIMTESSQKVMVRGLSLLVALAYLHDWRVYYFSTRRAPRVMNPDGSSATIAMLHHIDSFLGAPPEWFQLNDVIDYKVCHQ
ncbi:hypothetical protein BJV82DRAFT_217351 [Fennellomyces sp. T-0311]|nr:hypothetical protein BJV82DRAFT_217351 [Fennellomyces sp. T-0311]